MDHIGINVPRRDSQIYFLAEGVEVLIVNSASAPSPSSSTPCCA